MNGRERGVLRGLPSLFRSWRKEEQRTLPSPDSLRRWGMLLALPALLLLAAEFNRREVDLKQRQELQRREPLAIVVASLASIRRSALDWGHWDDLYAYVKGDNPRFLETDISTTSLFEEDGVLVLLSPTGAPLLTYSDQGQDRAEHLPLVACAESSRGRLKTVSSTVCLACRAGNGRTYLGVSTPISNSNSRAPMQGTLTLFEPLLKQEYGPAINTQLKDLAASFVPGKEQRLQPEIHGEGGVFLALRPTQWQRPLLAGVLRDLLRLLAVLAALLLIRGLVVLDRRRRLLLQRRGERLSNQRIRRASHELDRLLERMGLDSRSSAPEERILARLLTAEGSAQAYPSWREPAVIERKLEELGDRFQHFLVNARSLALLDSLTQLPNRRYFIERLELERERLRPLGRSFGLLFVDVDRFKVINDTYGHGIGDAALCLVAERLRAVLGPHDFLARYGGDEFAILIGLEELAPGTDLRSEANGLATRIARSFDSLARLQEIEVDLNISIGVNVVNPAESDSAMAMKRSDIAMYRAKQLGHTRIAIFDVDDGDVQLDNYYLFVDLMAAIRDRGLRVEFQPIVDCSLALHSVEALARWDHPRLGAIAPDVFLDLAENHRRMNILGDELIRLSLQGFRELKAHFPGLRLSLNLSPSKLSDPGLVSRLRHHLSQFDIDPHALTVELTERSVLMSNEAVKANLAGLRDLGTRLSLDDFGTGYSSLSLLQSLQPDELKIDKSFVMAVEKDVFAHQIVILVVQMAKRMGLEIVAEGVDNERSVLLLQQLGVAYFQGYYYCRPHSAAELIRLAQERSVSRLIRPGSAAD